jgi:hypothetical protein
MFDHRQVIDDGQVYQVRRERERESEGALVGFSFGKLSKNGTKSKGGFIFKKEIPLTCVRKKATRQIKFAQIIRTKLCPPLPAPSGKKKKNSHDKNLVQNCSKLSRKVVQNCAKIVQKINFSKSPEIAAAAARRNLAQKFPCCWKRTTNEQTNNSRRAERRRNCNVAKCGEMCKQNVLIQAAEEEEEESNGGTRIVIVVK